MSRSFFVVIALTLAVLTVFAQARHFAFIDYDDPGYILENPHVKAGLTLPGVAWAFDGVHEANWHPLTWLSHMLDCQIFGLDAGGPHLVNVGFHWLNCILLYWILLHMTRQIGPSALVALLFAIHPLHVESVAWISERKDMLSTFLGLLMIAAHLRYTHGKNWRWYIAVIVLFALAFMAKPMVLTIPFVLLLLDYWPLARFSDGRGAMRLVIEKLPLLAMVAGGCVITMYSQRGAEALSTAIPFWPRVSNALISYVSYLGKTFIPIHLGVGYPHPAVLHVPIGLTAPLLCLAILGSITVAAVRLRKSCPYFIIGWLWYLGMLVPVIGLVQVGQQAMADRYTYLPLVGIFIALAWGARDLIAHVRWRRSIAWALSTCVVASCIVLARRQAGYWSSSLSLFQHSVAVIPNNYIAHDCLGMAYHHAGLNAKSMREFKAALVLSPTDAEAHSNLGALYNEQNRPDLAMGHLMMAIRFHRHYAEAHNNLGNTLDAMGKTQAAQRQYEIALRQKPELPQAHYNLGRILGRQRHLHEAIAQFRQAVELDPRYANAHHALAIALGREGRSRDAIEQERAALQVKPDWPDALSHLGWLLATDADASVRQPAEAVDLAFHACKLTGFREIGPVDTLAAACAADGRFSDAVHLAQRACDMARQGGQNDRAIEIERRLALYRERRPYFAGTLAATRPTTATADLR